MLVLPIPGQSVPWGGAGAKRVKPASMSGPVHYDMAAGDSVSADAGSADPKSGVECIDCNHPADVDYHPRCWSCGSLREEGGH